MFSTIVLAIGVLLVIEGLAYALFPSTVKRTLSFILLLPIEQIRFLGLAAAVSGALMVWFSVR